MLEKKSLVTSVIWKFFERGSVQIINLITQIVLARILAPELFGSLSLIIVIYNLADLFVQKGFSSSLIRKKKISKYDLDTTFLISILLSIILYVSMFLLAPVIASFYNNYSLINPLRILMINLLLAPFYCVGNALLIRDLQFKTIFYRGLFSAIISGGFGIFIALNGFGLWSLVIQVVLNQVVNTLFVILKVKWRPGTNFSYEAFKDVFSFGKNVLLTEFLLYFVENVRTMVIGKQYSSTELAYYDRGQVYPATLMRAINDTIFSTLLPHLSKHQSNKSKLISEYIRLTYFALVIVVPLFFGFAAVASELVEIILTDEWLPSVPYIVIFCLYQAIFPYQITGKVVVYATGNSKKVLHIEVIKSIISLLLMLFTMNFGVIYIAISLIFVRLISDILYSRSVENEFDVKINIFRHTWKPFIAAAIMYVAVNLVGYLNISILLILIIKVFVGIITYISIIYVLDPELIGSIKKGANIINNKR